MAACGLDFGTSNTTLGVAAIDGQPVLAPLEGKATTLPSAVFFDFESGGMMIGQAAVDAYVSGADGRLMRALKSVLGTALIDEDTMLQQSRIGFGLDQARFADGLENALRGERIRHRVIAA